jgi:hypothetical protein
MINKDKCMSIPELNSWYNVHILCTIIIKQLIRANTDNLLFRGHLEYMNYASCSVRCLAYSKAHRRIKDHPELYYC